MIAAYHRTPKEAAVCENVLLVEDNPLHRDIEGEALRAAEFTVRSAANKGEALQALRDLAADPEPWLLVLDMRLCGDREAGIEILSAIEKGEGPAKLYVLMASALSRQEVYDQLREKGLTQHPFLSKPFLNRELVEAVKLVARGELRPDGDEEEDEAEDEDDSDE
jgi:CheY-like chemotaxis protein